MTATEELTEALEDPRMTMEFYVIGKALVEVSDKLDRVLRTAEAERTEELEQTAS